MRIAEVHAQEDRTLTIVAEDGRVGVFDVKPYLAGEVFEALNDPEEFRKVRHGGYYIAWDCGADLSADTIEARWRVKEHAARHAPG